MSGSITIRRISITALETEAIVNAANTGLWAGGGVCGAIFDAAGYDQLQAACNQIGHCNVGDAVITPGFNLKAKYIIHAVGPQWSGGNHHEPLLLYNAYRRSLELAIENGCHSIGFPLISAGIFGYPSDKAWRKAIQACQDFQKKHSQDRIDIVFAVISDDAQVQGEKMLRELSANSTPANSTSRTFDRLLINGIQHKAIYFHKPEEPDGFLSNWYPAAFDLDGLHFTSTEQYIMYRKCAMLGDDAAAQHVLETDDIAEQQEIGRNAKPYNKLLWEGSRQAIAIRCLMAKFSQNSILNAQLIATEDAYLVECAYKDHTWACGRGLDEDERKNMAQWNGLNILGFALMEVREMLKTQEG